MLQRTGQHALYNLLDSRGKCLCRQRYPTGKRPFRDLTAAQFTEHLASALHRHQLVLVQVDRQRPYPWSILGRSAHLGGKRSPARLLTTRTDHLFYPVFADLDSPHRQVLHLPTFDYVASHSL